jgi:hypothetical protein
MKYIIAVIILLFAVAALCACMLSSRISQGRGE